jgi:hypothetical protein
MATRAIPQPTSVSTSRCPAQPVTSPLGAPGRIDPIDVKPPPLGEPALEEGTGGGNRERARGARSSVSEPGQPQALTVRDHRRHGRGVVVLVLELTGDQERRDGKRSEVVVPDADRPAVRAARGEEGLRIGPEGDGLRPRWELAVERVPEFDPELLDQGARPAA